MVNAERSCSGLDPVRLVIAVACCSFGLSACDHGSKANADLPDTISTLEGRIIQQVDDPPFTYAKLKLEAGEAWVAIPVGSRSIGDTVRLTGCVAVQNLKSRAAGGTLPKVYMGSLQGP